MRQGKHLAKNLGRVLSGRPTTPCDIQSQGMLAAFGHHDAVAKVGRMKLTGFPAWFLWRSVYLMKMPGLARGARIALDWTADLLFGRDYVQLGVHRDDGHVDDHGQQDLDKEPASETPQPAEATR